MKTIQQPLAVGIAAIGAALLLSAELAYAVELVVEIEGVKTAQGDILVALYASPETFLRQPARGVKTAAATSTVSVTFKDIPAGAYALTAFHDENADGKLDRNPVGIPTEPVGFSRDAVGVMGPPKFDDAKVAIDGDTQVISIQLR